MEKMNRVRAISYPDSAPSSSTVEQYDDSALEGVAANVKLLLKLIQDHKEACRKHTNDGRRMLRVAGMMTILDNVRTRIQKCQSFGNTNKPLESELPRCATDPKSNPIPRPSPESGDDEKEKLKKDLAASLAARKSLEIMCSSLGKEREIMAAEIARKVRESNEMEELIGDLKAQNESLLSKVRESAATTATATVRGGGEGGGAAALQERNKVLSEQLLRSLEGYRSAKRRMKEAQEESSRIQATVEEVGAKVRASLDWIRAFKSRIATRNGRIFDDKEEVMVLGQMLEWLETKVSKYCQKKGNKFVQPKG